MDKQINHDKLHDESKTRTQRLSKLPDDGDPWALNNLLTPERKKNTRGVLDLEILRVIGLLRAAR